ncbi:hypothetical protein SBA1_350004 [Candidatus Sulfotelmatobacter kueseliae]|uniref:Uncharacterized protein n=1 Tax=Candidatus Sulfotelmatobacter kueseliae TaxID=2042962 RepID=A0A2U3KNN3_9BACT|nr:hypothetical protein SBA1_350004 [Candidatus Sulfotelmatobacter kueseliae]
MAARGEARETNRTIVIKTNGNKMASVRRMRQAPGEGQKILAELLVGECFTIGTDLVSRLSTPSPPSNTSSLRALSSTTYRPP